MKAVELGALAVDLGGRRLLGPLDLELEEGSWTRVVGPSGSGKTTLLRAIAGLQLPSAGTLGLSGRAASTGSRILIAPERRAIGFVFQGAGAGLWPHLSARATLAFVLACRGVPRGERRARADELLERVGLRALEARRPGELSGGEAQRLALARALAVEPRLLLLDEPLGALEAPLRAALVDLLAEVHARARPTILHVTHDPQEAREHVDRQLSLEGGRIVSDWLR